MYGVTFEFQGSLIVLYSVFKEVVKIKTISRIVRGLYGCK